MKALAMAPALALAFAEAQGFTDGSNPIPAVRNVLLKAAHSALQHNARSGCRSLESTRSEQGRSRTPSGSVLVSPY
jgi:hypothetical protein